MILNYEKRGFMKIGIYSPYLDTFGGGERYILTVTECLSAKHEVDVLLDNHLYSLGKEFLKKNLSLRLHINLSRVNFIKAPIGAGSNFLQRIRFLKSFDFLFYLTDGSVFYSTAKNSVLHFQVPFENVVAKGLWGKKKLRTWKLAIYNSNFTKDIVEKTWDIRGRVVYPPVDVDVFQPLKKEKIILSVGRFFDFLHSKKQDVLVKSFANMVKNGLSGWKLILAGGTNQGGKKFLKKIKDQAAGLPVKIYPDISFDKLKSLYGQASIYWHAAGFGEKDPKKMEHFGITTVEAMAAGVVPVVIASGGQVEIVENEKSGFLWKTPQELENLTKKLINDQELMKKLSQAAQKRSKIFSKDNFCQSIRQIIDGYN